MRRHNRRRRQAFRLGTIAVFGLAASTSSASAQDGQADLSVGYLNVSGSRHGVIVQASMALTPRWSIVGEFDMSNGPDSGCSVGCGPNFRDIAGLGGFRFAWHPTVRFAPFWQILAGGLHSKAEDYYVDYCCGLGRRLQPGFTVGYLALQPGGGVTAMVTPRFGLRAQAGLQLAIPDQSQWEGMSIFPRVAVSGVIRLGSIR